jgi:hypothetical protein
MSTTVVGETTLHHGARKIEGGQIEIGGERFYRIVNYDAMAPFLMSIVGDSDHWMFVSSTGALTAGRRDPDRALFPYTTDDRLHDSQDQTGGKTIFLIACAGRTALWEPFSKRCEGLYRVTRSLSKSVYSNKLIFEEVNYDLGLSFSYAWMSSDRFGFVRRSAMVNLGEKPVEIDLLDGIQNLMPAGLTNRFQLEYSNLADGYKENELDWKTGLGLFKLSSVPADRPEPNEALRVTTVWSEGLESARRLLSSVQLDRFRRGEPMDEEPLIRGRRGAYFMNTRLHCPQAAAKSGASWRRLSRMQRKSLRLLISSSPAETCARSSTKTSTRHHEPGSHCGRGRRPAMHLRRPQLGPAFLQCSVQHHARGNSRARVPGFTIRLQGVHRQGQLFLSRADEPPFSNALPETLPHSHLLALAREQEDPDLERLAHEYLPLTFSRRHGDPSRPWNIFAIKMKNEQNERILNYQGNWRDIFQNWEALALSFPGYIESMIFKFVDSSTADGHNPYRIMRDGYEWEVLDPHDAWSYIGYWGDHQAAYLLKLLELSARYHPGILAGLLARRVFTYANIPYRIRPYSALLEDPRNTIDFDAALDSQIQQRVAAMGADGKALPGPDGAPYRVNLTEKLLVLVLARLFNFIPEAGLWMNTQRPEWNDANNALVGSGVSMVTLCYLRRLLAFCRATFAAAMPCQIEVSSEVAEAFHGVAEALERHASLLGGPISDRDRKVVLDDLGSAGSDYRAKIYARGFSGRQTPLGIRELARLLRHGDQLHGPLDSRQPARGRPVSLLQPHEA